MLVMDTFSFYGHGGKKEPYLLSVESRTGHLHVYRKANKTAATLLAVIHRFLNYYKGHGHAVKTKQPCQAGRTRHPDGEESLSSHLEFARLQPVPPSPSILSHGRRGYIEKLYSKRDPADIPRAKVSHPLTLNCIQPTATAPISLPPHSLSSEIMELRYLDYVRPDIKFATAQLTINMSSPTVSL